MDYLVTFNQRQQIKMISEVCALIEKKVMLKLNYRLRKTLNLKTPYALFIGDDKRQTA